MAQPNYQADLSKTHEFLYQLISRQAKPDALSWLDQQLDKFKSGFKKRDFFLSFSAVPRFLGKAALKLDDKDFQEAYALRKGFSIKGWTIDRAARVLIILSLPNVNEQEFKSILDTIFSTAEVSELVALYSSLPLLPYPENFQDRAAEGIRTNMTVVFDTVALDNPYPAEFLNDTAWNQMVLKAVFMERPLYRIQGLDNRANPKLAKMLSDYAHERWAASRYVTPELWRPVGPFVDEQLISDIQRLFDKGNELEQKAAALACTQSESKSAQELLDQYQALKDQVAQNQVTWQQVGQAWMKNKNLN